MCFSCTVTLDYSKWSIVHTPTMGGVSIPLTAALDQWRDDSSKILPSIVFWQLHIYQQTAPYINLHVCNSRVVKILLLSMLHATLQSHVIFPKYLPTCSVKKSVALQNLEITFLLRSKRWCIHYSLPLPSLSPEKSVRVINKATRGKGSTRDHVEYPLSKNVLLQERR